MKDIVERYKKRKAERVAAKMDGGPGSGKKPKGGGGAKAEQEKAQTAKAEEPASTTESKSSKPLKFSMSDKAVDKIAYSSLGNLGVTDGGGGSIYLSNTKKGTTRGKVLNSLKQSFADSGAYIVPEGKNGFAVYKKEPKNWWDPCYSITVNKGTNEGEFEITSEYTS